MRVNGFPLLTVWRPSSQPDLGLFQQKRKGRLDDAGCVCIFFILGWNLWLMGIVIGIEFKHEHILKTSGVRITLSTQSTEDESVILNQCFSQFNLLFPYTTSDWQKEWRMGWRDGERQGRWEVWSRGYARIKQCERKGVHNNHTVPLKIMMDFPITIFLFQSRL